MTFPFESIDAAFEALSDPSSERWAQAFAFLFSNPDTSGLMMETFRDTLKDMGAEASGTDPETGEPMYTLKDVAKAMGIPESDLDRAIGEARPDGEE